MLRAPDKQRRQQQQQKERKKIGKKIGKKGKKREGNWKKGDKKQDEKFNGSQTAGLTDGYIFRAPYIARNARINFKIMCKHVISGQLLNTYF